MERANAYDAQLLSFMGGSKAGDSAAGAGRVATLIEYHIQSNKTPSLRLVVIRVCLHVSENCYFKYLYNIIFTKNAS